MNKSIFKKIFFSTISILVGLIFVFSGYTKLYPIEPFEFNFIEHGFANWLTAPIIARLLIGLEFGLGLFLILNFSLQKFTLKATIGLLLFFNLYLIFGLIQDGNAGNCGCFGNTFQMTPLQAIYKNIGLLIACLILFFTKHNFEWRFKKAIWVVSIIAGLAVPYILNVPEFFYIKNNIKEEVNYKLPIELIYKDTLNKPTIDLYKGKHLIGFFSLTCPHCRIAAMKFHLFQKRNPDLSFFMVLYGEATSEANFFETTKSEEVRHVRVNDKDFMKLCGPSVPVIMLIEDAIVKRKIDYLDLNENDAVSYLKN